MADGAVIKIYPADNSGKFKDRYHFERHSLDDPTGGNRRSESKHRGSTKCLRTQAGAVVT